MAGRRPWLHTLAVSVLALASGFAITLFFVLDDSPPRATGHSASAPTPPTTTLTPTTSASLPPDPEGPREPAADGRPWRCASTATRGAGLIAAVEEAMEGYAGAWGLALVDLDCDSAVVVRPLYAQYPASAGKIVVLTAALRAVQEGVLDFAMIEADVELVLHHSIDKNTDNVAAFVTPARVAAVLERARISERSALAWAWREAWFTPHDLALVWASILRGDQLDERWTAYLLARAAEAVLPDGRETFPAEFGVAGYEFGQKAGYWINPVQPDHLVAAGYARPEDGASAGFTFAFLLQTSLHDLFDPQRRQVFPLVRDFIVDEVRRSR